MVSDVKLDGNSVIIETDNNAKGNKLILDDTCLKGQVFDFDLDHPDRRDPNATNPRRRALVHGPGDKLVVNWDGDYPGGVEILGKVNIQNPIVGKIADLTIINNLTVENASNDGINILNAIHAGLDIIQSSGFGILIEQAANGITIKNAAGNGFHVMQAGNAGLYIQKSGGIGILVDEATGGVIIQNVSGNGFEVDNAGNSGIYVKKSGGAGILVDEAVNGVSVQKASGNGFQVVNAGDNGLRINKAQNNGVDIEEVGNDFFTAGPPADRKFRVRKDGMVDCKMGFSVLPGYAELVMTESGSPEGYTPGDVLQISDLKDRAVELANTPYSWKVAGIYVDKSGILGSNHPMGDIVPGEIPMAVTGIVPCRVSAEVYPKGNGPIKRGDILTTSATPGHAMKATQYKAGAILGKAFGELHSGKGIVDVLVNLL
jgi:ribosomal protein L13E